MYDVVVIGGGPAGMAAALEASKTSEKVVIIERLFDLPVRKINLNYSSIGVLL